jgi:hypothetical protein
VAAMYVQQASKNGIHKYFGLEGRDTKKLSPQKPLFSFFAVSRIRSVAHATKKHTQDFFPLFEI